MQPRSQARSTGRVTLAGSRSRSGGVATDLPGHLRRSAPSPISSRMRLHPRTRQIGRPPRSCRCEAWGGVWEGGDERGRLRLRARRDTGRWCLGCVRLAASRGRVRRDRVWGAVVRRWMWPRKSVWASSGDSGCMDCVWFSGGSWKVQIQCAGCGVWELCVGEKVKHD